MSIKRVFVAASWLISSLLWAQDWHYSVRFDSFDNSRTDTAVLRGESSAALELSLPSRQPRSAFLSGARFDCFPACMVLVKFDDGMPEVFEASGARVISTVVRIHDFQQLVDRMATAKRVTFRAPLHQVAKDLEFLIAQPYDPSNFARAERRAAISKQCEANAVNENYQVCMDRLGKLP